MKPTIKAKFNNKTKGLLSSKIKDYQSLVSTIKAQFTSLKQPFRMYYEKNNTKICIDDQEDYSNIDFNTDLKIQIIGNIIQSSNSKSKDNIKEQSSLQQSSQVFITNQKELYEESFKTTKHIQKESIQKLQVKQSTSILNRNRDSLRNYTGQCVNCKSNLMVQKWKCPSQNGFSFDICQKCYDHDKQKQKYVDINDESFWSKINYTHAIANIFDSKYNKQKQIDSLEVRDWISQQDILKNRPNFINRVQSCSEQIVNTIIINFDCWQREYQSKLQQIKSK